METISGMAQAAANAVWGTNGNTEEPVSGKQGDVSKGEPYDAGNIEPQEKAVAADTAKPSSDVTASTTSPKTTAVTDAPVDEHKPKPTAIASNKTAPTPTPTSTSTDPVPSSTSDSTTTNPAAVKDSSLGSKDVSHVQSDVRDPSEPTTDPTNAAAKANVDDTTDGPDTGDNPQKFDKPLKTVEEVARERGGDAGKIDAAESTTATTEGTTAGAGAGADEEEDGPQKKSHGSGTGEQWVKSTGLQADGGDFDATKPGAGREADRLLEEKGVKRQIGNDAAKPTPESSAAHKQDTTTTTTPAAAHHEAEETSGKTKLKDKIKGVFHHKSKDETS